MKACWAHTRRKFHDIHVVHASPTTTEALTRIGALYGIEEQIRGKPAELRSSIRQDCARPPLDHLRQWMEKTRRSLSTKSETANAIRLCSFTLPPPPPPRALTRYVDNGLLEIDNSAAERALRAVAIGRKNYLFPGSGFRRPESKLRYTASSELPSWRRNRSGLLPANRTWKRSPSIRSIASKNSALEYRHLTQDRLFPGRFALD